MSKILAILKSAKEAVVAVLLGLFVAYIFMYEYIPTGYGIIYKINRYTHETYWNSPSHDEWEKIKPHKQTLWEEFDENYKPSGGKYDDLLDQIKK